MVEYCLTELAYGRDIALSVAIGVLVGLVAGAILEWKCVKCRHTEPPNRYTETLG